MVLESGLLQEREERYELTGPLPPLAIPATLHDSLMARLDRLATVKALAQLGATLGREFSYALLQAVSPWDEATLQRGLHQLVEAEFLYQRGLPPQATYLFKHALIQDAAYQSLLRSTRQQYHQRIAQVLEARFPETVRDPARAAGASLYRGGPAARRPSPTGSGRASAPSQRSAHLEAISHLTKGLELLKTLPDTPERTQQELALADRPRPGAGWPPRAMRRPEVEQPIPGRAQLCRQVGETPQLFPVLWGLWRFYLVRAEYQTARELGEQLLTPGPARRTTRRCLLAAHQALGTTSFYLGEFAAARSAPGAGDCAL